MKHLLILILFLLFSQVDSILVKCLRQGSWLLMDNVNMCSAAVLDRLNGLLEPKGVLTLHERGKSNNKHVFNFVQLLNKI